MRQKGQIDYCYTDVSVDGHPICVGFRGRVMETYINDFHFIVDEITSAALVLGRKVRYLRLTDKFAKKLKDIIENENGRLKLPVEATAENARNTPRDKELIQI